MDPRIKPRTFSAVEMARELKNKRLAEVQKLYDNVKKEDMPIMEALRQIATPLRSALQAKRAYELALFNANASEELEPDPNPESENVAEAPPGEEVVTGDETEVRDEPTAEALAEGDEEEEEGEEEVEIGGELIDEEFEEEEEEEIEVDPAEEFWGGG